MQQAFPTYPFTPILGWSISRYEVFDKCKRQYYYTYYGKHTKQVPVYKINQLKSLTSIPLETGNAVHDVLEAFLKRLQKSDRDIDEQRFFQFARELLRKYFTEKTFMELYYGYEERLNIDRAIDKVETCLRNFIESSCYNWIFMVALHNRDNWIIEPAGYGETRLNELKVYCKMDFLLPVDDCMYILDWKTGKRDEMKHGAQLMGYSAAANSIFSMPWNRIFPRIVYLYPEFDEMEIDATPSDKERFFSKIQEQTNEMYKWCVDVDNNIPKPMEEFTMNPSPQLCRQCKFRELCFPDCRNENNTGIPEF